MFIMTEYTEGHTHNTYHTHKAAAIADMKISAGRDKTTDRVQYRVWSYADATGYVQQTHAETTREAAEPACMQCSQPVANKYAAYCHHCEEVRNAEFWSQRPA